MIDLNEFAKQVHENAVAHGWWETKRSFGEVIALIHSELSEALEEYRNGHAPTETYYSEGGKPEGIPSELADVVIRVLDWCGFKGWVYKGRDYSTIAEELQDVFDSGEATEIPSLGKLIADLHKDVSDFYENEVSELTDLIEDIFAVCAMYKIDLESAMLEKHEYNKTRLYKHGGKVI